MRGGRGRIIIHFIGLFISLTSLAQEIRVNGGFVEDSLLIGQDVNFYVTAEYPAALEMVFPDSTYDFSPFEYSDKTYFPSTLSDATAFDSTVYTIQSYEIDLVQYLQLETVILDGTDSLVLSTPLDSIYFRELAPMVSDTTSLIANSEYQDVIRFFNYPLMYIILGALAVLLIVLLLIFGKRIIRFFKLRKLRKEYENFALQLSGYISKLKSEPEADLAESALITWKKYQEKLDRIPFTKLTTKEILVRDFTSELEKPLKSIDRLVYGKRDTVSVYQDFQQIENFAQHRYNKKVEEIRHGN